MFLINNVYWKLSVVPADFPLLMRFDGSYALGSCDSLIRTIYINENIHDNLLKKVLCHEIVHAAMFSYGIDLSLDQEELVANLISTYGDEIIYITNKIFSKLENNNL